MNFGHSFFISMSIMIIFLLLVFFLTKRWALFGDNRLNLILQNSNRFVLIISIRKRIYLRTTVMYTIYVYTGPKLWVC